MAKIIVEFDDDMDPVSAIWRAFLVVKGGKVSNGRGIPHYCWLTKIQDGSTVHAKQKAKETSADVLVVRKPNA